MADAWRAGRIPNISPVTRAAASVNSRTQDNIRGRRIVLVQEGITDPEDRSFRLVQRHRWLPLLDRGHRRDGPERRLPRVLRRQRRVPRPLHPQGREGGEDRGHRHPELRRLRALSRQRLSRTATTCWSARRRCGRSSAARTGKSFILRRRQDRQRAPDDLQVPPQRRPRAGREGSEAVRPGRPDLQERQRGRDDRQLRRADHPVLVDGVRRPGARQGNVFGLPDGRVAQAAAGAEQRPRR